MGKQNISQTIEITKKRTQSTATSGLITFKTCDDKRESLAQI